MVSSFPQAGPCICEVAPRWLGSCHLYYRSASICAAQQPRPSSTASKGASLRRNTLQLEALRVRFSYDAKIVQAFRSSIPIQFPWKDGNFSGYRPTGWPMPVPVSPRATENNLMSLKRERISQRPVKHRLWNIGGVLLVSNPDAAVTRFTSFRTRRGLVAQDRKEVGALWALVGPLLQRYLCHSFTGSSDRRLRSADVKQRWREWGYVYVYHANIWSNQELQLWTLQKRLSRSLFSPGRENRNDARKVRLPVPRNCKDGQGFQLLCTWWAFLSSRHLLQFLPTSLL